MRAHSLFFSSNLCITTITFFFLCAFFSNASNEYAHHICSHPWLCGNVSGIGYPFWGYGRPSYCGHPYLHLHCPYGPDDYPFMKIDHYFPNLQVLNISNDRDKSLMTIKFEQMDSNYSCHTNYSKNYGIFRKYHFSFSSNVSITRLYYDCPGYGLHDSDSVSCFDIHNSTKATYQLSNHTKPDNCKFFEVPVLGKELNKLQHRKETLEGVLAKGFEVDFNYSPCTKCLNSGGACGSAGKLNKFVCYCKDHSDNLNLEECPKPEKWKQKLALILAIFGALCFLIALHVAVCCYMKITIKYQITALLSKSPSSYHIMSDPESGNSFFGIPVFSYEELQEATNNFDSARELGDGGFGVVYYGKLMDGREVAIKRLYEKNFKRVGQFMNEIEILTTLRHQNLVTLYGCTSRHSRELLLVYEFIPNGTVAEHLYAESSKSKTLNRSGTLPWSVPMKIAIQTACALSYLHASDIIHRDVKTNNILLDNEFIVKVADFGLSRLFPFDATHVSTTPQGTPGYLDPEYHKCYQVTSKSDVYSFGVVLIELISSLPAIDLNRHEDEINLSDYAMNKIQKGKLESLVDKNLGFQSDFKVTRMTSLVAELAFRCLQQEKDVRPSMEEVYENLKRIESADYEAFEIENMGWGTGILKPTNSLVEEDEVEHHQEYPCTPNSMIGN